VTEHLAPGPKISSSRRQGCMPLNSLLLDCHGDAPPSLASIPPSLPITSVNRCRGCPGLRFMPQCLNSSRQPNASATFRAPSHDDLGNAGELTRLRRRR